MDSLLLIGRILESLIGFGHNKSLVGWPLQGGMDVMELTRLEAPMEIAAPR